MRILTTPDTPFNLDIHKGREADHSQVRSVANRLIVLRGAQFSAPLLRDALFIDLDEGATLDAPALTAVAGTILLRPGATLRAPALRSVNKIETWPGSTVVAPLVEHRILPIDGWGNPRGRWRAWT